MNETFQGDSKWRGILKMWKIVSITNHDGKIKQEFYDEIKAIHPNMSGEILYPHLLKVGSCLCLEWDDDSCKMLRTSKITKIREEEFKLIITTRNSVYTLEEVKENN